MDKKRKEMQVVGQEASRGVLAEAQAWFRGCNSVWLVLGVLSGWVLDAAVNAAFALLNVIPIVGPLIVDTILGPLDEIVVAAIPLLCLDELVRRWLNRRRTQKE